MGSNGARAPRGAGCTGCGFSAPKASPRWVAAAVDRAKRGPRGGWQPRSSARSGDPEVGGSRGRAREGGTPRWVPGAGGRGVGRAPGGAQTRSRASGGDHGEGRAGGRAELRRGRGEREAGRLRGHRDCARRHRQHRRLPQTSQTPTIHVHPQRDTRRGGDLRHHRSGKAQTWSDIVRHTQIGAERPVDATTPTAVERIRCDSTRAHNHRRSQEPNGK